MLILQSQSVTGIEENKEKLFSYSSTHISKADMDGTLLLNIRFETLLSNN